MYRIGIIGSSGSGKTTFTNYLSMLLPNVAIIHCDDFLRPAIEANSRLLTELFGTIRRAPDGHIRLSFFCEDVITYKRTIEIITPFINEMVLRETGALTDKAEYTIYDGGDLSSLSIWDSLHKKILIISDSGLQLNRLKERDFSGDCAAPWLNVRMEQSVPSDIGTDIVTVFNNSGKGELFKKTLKIALSIRGC